MKNLKKDQEKYQMKKMKKDQMKKQEKDQMKKQEKDQMKKQEKDQMKKQEKDQMKKQEKDQIKKLEKDQMKKQHPIKALEITFDNLPTTGESNNESESAAEIKSPPKIKKDLKSANLVSNELSDASIRPSNPPEKKDRKMKNKRVGTNTKVVDVITKSRSDDVIYVMSRDERSLKRREMKTIPEIVRRSERSSRLVTSFPLNDVINEVFQFRKRSDKLKATMTSSSRETLKPNEEKKKVFSQMTPLVTSSKLNDVIKLPASKRFDFAKKKMVEDLGAVRRSDLMDGNPVKK